jgi:uncharacterized membrane protein YhaH (DUF805 family)
MTEYSSDTVPATPSLDLPLYGAGPVEAVKRFYQNYAKFSGRASRSEYWWVAAFFFIAYGALGLLIGVIGSATATVGADGKSEPGGAIIPFAVIIFVLFLGSIVPSIAVAIRRLHDAGFSGLIYLITLVPYLGSFVLFILYMLPSSPLGVRFDLQPVAAAPNAGLTTPGQPLV